MHVLLAALVLTAPVVPQAPPLAVDLAAITLAGFADGVSAHLAFPGIVSRTGPGQFTLTGSAGATTDMTVVETGKCIFVFTFETPGEATIGLHLDTNKVSGIVYRPNGDRDGVPQYEALFSGAPGRVVFDLATGSVVAPDGPSQVVTSLPLADIEAGIEALHTTFCPGLAA